MDVNANIKSDMPQSIEMEMIEGSKTETARVDAGGIPLDEETRRLEKKLKWKLDLYILPLLTLVYFFATMVSNLF